MRVSVSIYEEEVEGDYGYCDGLRLTCDKCGFSVEVGGTSDRSAARGATMLRDGCPEGENNYYDASWWSG